jgi:hypothetical protein
MISVAWTICSNDSFLRIAVFLRHAFANSVLSPALPVTLSRGSAVNYSEIVVRAGAPAPGDIRLPTTEIDENPYAN